MKQTKLYSLASLALGGLSVLALASCGNKLVSAVDDWKSAACACKDKACAEKQKEAFNKIESDFHSEIDEASKSDMKKLDKKLDAANECLGKFDVRAG